MKHVPASDMAKGGQGRARPGSRAPIRASRDAAGESR